MLPLIPHGHDDHDTGTVLLGALKSVSNKAVFITAPATPGLLFIHIHYIVKTKLSRFFLLLKQQDLCSSYS